MCEFNRGRVLLNTSQWTVPMIFKKTMYPDLSGYRESWYPDASGNLVLRFPDASYLDLDQSEQQGNHVLPVPRCVGVPRFTVP